jgi:hypothetical protein
MKIEYPLYFTKKGKGWKKSPKDVTLNYEDGTSKTTRVLKKADLECGDFKIEGKSAFGYFENDSGEKIRITNIVGCKNGKLRKRCPKCGKKKSLKKFDLTGRDTAGKRDQSNCSKCRSKKKKD